MYWFLITINLDFLSLQRPNHRIKMSSVTDYRFAFLFTKTTSPQFFLIRWRLSSHIILQQCLLLFAVSITTKLLMIHRFIFFRFPILGNHIMARIRLIIGCFLHLNNDFFLLFPSKRHALYRFGLLHVNFIWIIELYYIGLLV